MRAMALTNPGGPLTPIDRPVPKPGPKQILLRVSACGVCRTDLHPIDGELPDVPLPVIPGHEIVGRIAEVGAGVRGMILGSRAGIPWLGSTCGDCWFCRHELENLCDHPEFTGYTIDGGYAEYAVADSSFCFPLPDDGNDVEAAPLLCAGLIGHRSLKSAGSGEHPGVYGFGAAGHIVAQVALWEGRRVYAFTRPGDNAAQDFALGLGVHWAGSSDEAPPHLLDAAIIFAPVGPLVPAALHDRLFKLTWGRSRLSAEPLVGNFLREPPELGR